MTLEEKYKASRLAKAVDEARLGYVFLPAQKAVMIHSPTPHLRGLYAEYVV